MANFEIPETPEYNGKMRKLESTDAATAELFNGMFEQLLENEAYLQKKAKEAGENKMDKDGNASNTTVAFSEASKLAVPVSGNKLSTLFGIVAKAVSSLISHLANSTIHHSHSNKAVLDSTTASYTTEEQTKLKDIASGANAYTHPNSGVTAGTYRSVTVNAAGHVTAGSNPTVTVAQGGTGLTASPSMLTNLGSTTAANVLQASPRPGVTGTLPIAKGGTGATTAVAALSNLGTVPVAISASAPTSGLWVVP